MESTFNKRLSDIYITMKRSCTNPSAADYDRYGGKGIRVCEEWMESYHAFRDWALENGYSDDLTLDRINGLGNYEPGNCRWATYSEQANNRKDTVWVTIMGESKPIAVWAKEAALPYGAIKARYRAGKRGNDLIKPLTEVVVEVGEEMYTIKELSEISGIKPKTISKRYYDGIRGQDLIAPLRRGKKW